MAKSPAPGAEVARGHSEVDEDLREWAGVARDEFVDGLVDVSVFL